MFSACPPLLAYVEKADGDAVRVALLDGAIRGALEAIGFSDAGSGWLGLLTGTYLRLAGTGPGHNRMTLE